MDTTLKYTDETDKSLGIAGMAISLVACDGEALLASVSLEEGDDSMMFSEEFFFAGNPRLSAKIAWNELLKQYQVASAMLMGNIMCRRFAAGHGVESPLLQIVRDLLSDAGHTHCSLEDDEIETLFNKNYRYYTRLFSHGGVLSVARDLATTLRMRRRMTAGEVFEQLSRLNSL